MTRMRVWFAVAAVVATATGAAAQPGAPVWRPWRPVVAVGGVGRGSEALGAVTISTRAVATGTSTPPPFTLFRTDSSLDGGIGGEAVVLVPVTPVLAVEVTGSAGRRTLVTAISGDAEGAPATTASERIDEYQVGGRLSYLLPVGTWRRGRPFLAAGGAYLRQLHEDNVLVEHGQAWAVSGGAHLWVRQAARWPVGLTAEAGWQWRSGGITLADGVRSSPTAGVRLFVGL